MAKCKHIKDKDGKYSGCYHCKYYFDLYSDIFGSCPMCEHDPNPDPELLFEIRDHEAPCPYFDYDVFIPTYKNHLAMEEWRRKRKL